MEERGKDQPRFKRFCGATVTNPLNSAPPNKCRGGAALLSGTDRWIVCLCEKQPKVRYNQGRSTLNLFGDLQFNPILYSNVELPGLMLCNLINLHTSGILVPPCCEICETSSRSKEVSSESPISLSADQYSSLYSRMIQPNPHPP